MNEKQKWNVVGVIGLFIVLGTYLSNLLIYGFEDHSLYFWIGMFLGAIVLLFGAGKIKAMEKIEESEEE